MATKEEDAIVKELNYQFRAIRAAPRNSEKAASLERELLKRLIELVTCPHSSVKIVVARNIPIYIKSCEDLEEAAINAVYDLCEDQDSNIRKEGYAAITSVSNNLPKYVKRNADVLVQLLQSDEPDEVKVVELQLVKHLDKNPAVTLNVLCDQIIPPEEDIDDEEQATRDRLRSLVIEFMTRRAKQNILRHAEDKESNPDGEFVDRVMRAISKIPPSDGERLVKDIILSLPAYKSGSPRSKDLFQALLTAAEHTYESESGEHKGDNSLTYTRHLMSLASFIARDKGLTDHLDEAPRLFVFDNVLSAYDAIPAQDLKGEISTQVRKSLVTACLPLFSSAVERHVDTPRPWSAYRGLLKASKQHATEMGWKVPSGMIPPLQTIQSQAKEEIAVAEGGEKTLLEEVQNLTLSLLDLSKGSLASQNRQEKTNSGPVHIKRDRQSQPQTASVGRQGSSSTMSRQGSTAQVGPRTTAPRQDQRFTQQRRNNAGPFTAQDQFNPHKRLAVEVSTPTLLSRLALADHSKQSRAQTPTRTVPAKRPAESDGQSQRRPNNPQVKATPSSTGFSIKGAATRQLESEKSVPLLNRLVTGGDAEGRRRKRPKI